MTERLKHMQTELYSKVINFFEVDDWSFQKFEDSRAIGAGFEGKSGRWKCYVKCRELQSQLIFYSLYPNNIPKQSMLEVAEFITRANYGMTLGAFELDMSCGNLRYRTGIDVEGNELSFSLIENLIYYNLEVMDQYFSFVEKVIDKTVSPEEAAASAEES